MADDQPRRDATEGPGSSVDHVEAVLWDVGGVILDLGSVRAGHRAFAAWLAEAYGLGPVEDVIATWRQAVGDYFRERDGTAFRPAREAYARAVAACVGEPVPRAAWEDPFWETVGSHLRATEGAAETIERLAAAGLHQGVVSDIDAAEGRFILGRLGVLDAFDAVTTSEDVGRTKPDPAIFEAALEAAGVAPDRALMVGDRYRHDMAGAARLGIHTAAFGAADGPAVEYRLASLRDLPVLVGVES